MSAEREIQNIVEIIHKMDIVKNICPHDQMYHHGQKCIIMASEGRQPMEFMAYYWREDRFLACIPPLRRFWIMDVDMGGALDILEQFFVLPKYLIQATSTME